MIPEAAVEAAWHAFWNHQSRSGIESMRQALEAAAPHMPSPPAAEVWDEAATVLYMGKSIGPELLQAMFSRNPYKATP